LFYTVYYYNIIIVHFDYHTWFLIIFRTSAYHSVLYCYHRLQQLKYSCYTNYVLYRHLWLLLSTTVVRTNLGSARIHWQQIRAFNVYQNDKILIPSLPVGRTWEILRISTLYGCHYLHRASKLFQINILKILSSLNSLTCLTCTGKYSFLVYYRYYMQRIQQLSVSILYYSKF